MSSEQELKEQLLREDIKIRKLQQAKLRREAEDDKDRSDRERLAEEAPILLASSINETAYVQFIRRLYYMHERGVDPITVIINSPGGYVIDGLAMVDAVNSVKRADTEVITVAQGEVASMGGVLFQTGTKRLMAANAWLLIHEVSGGVYGKTSDLADDLKQMQRLEDRCLDILAERSTLTKAQIKRRWVKKDWWLNADEAIKLGFADGLLD